MTESYLLMAWFVAACFDDGYVLFQCVMARDIAVFFVCEFLRCNSFTPNRIVT